TLTYHKKGNLIKCHYCGLNEAFGNKCFNCSENYYGLGLGTQKIDEEVRKMLPEAKVEIMDADTMKGKSKLL
ncbi:MAG: primosomal protein N', partial [Candidatus Dadabacteria bacterium]|nr:primosomal protein N' [Candidatus Dadabacteria bacterium]NIQ14729.1 primosomal protein N' [Candidatus Dadabacteria bacterium]